MDMHVVFHTARDGGNFIFKSDSLGVALTRVANCLTRVWCSGEASALC